MNPEEEAMKAYTEAGVDLPELKEEQPNKEEAPKEEPKPEEKEPAPKPKEEEPQEPLKEDPRPERKRSIYDEYKDKKSELKTERELREQVERERDELRAKLEARDNARTPEEKKDAQDEIEAFATKIGADPEAIREMRQLFLKDVQANTDPSIAQKLSEFEAWRAENSLAIEKQAFEQEFNSVIPTLKELVPNASEAEMQSIKTEIDRLSHTKEYHDKPLDYIAWKHKDRLSSLVSPKKRGVEPKGRVDAQEEGEASFDPNADLTKMTPKQRDAWEKEYRKMANNEELVTDAEGRKLII